ncbi:hypothetical protein NK718_19655 [Alsobacter sp. SYSU M60028]|uniref:Peptidase M15A C-terminal domain-containing protein n=1 Tax=Alsobacter ponti TaxID=2962936 RepID=A0ABT1LIM6_9HYPH|nr:hypothetical protein [Alsobacter ponti]MCP8940748.1 hypothetical protein [Alsobacter ponti]
MAVAMLSVSTPFAGSSPALADGPGCAGQVCFQPQVKGVSCLSDETRKMVEDIVARIGAIEITSTCGGRHARHSAHYRGKAVDFRPKATTPRQAAAALRGMSQVRGVGAYRNGLLHADTGDRVFAWGGAGSGRRRVRVAGQ